MSCRTAEIKIERLENEDYRATCKRCDASYTNWNVRSVKTWANWHRA